MPYFDNAASTLPKPQAVYDAVLAAMQSFGNPSRSAHPPALAAARCLLTARETLATFFGCPDPSRVVFTKNATEALNIAIRALPGKLVTSEAEHNSVLRPALENPNATVVPADEKGRVHTGDILAACQGAAGVVLSHASNLTGNCVDIAAIGRYCRENDVIFVVDAAQTAGLLPLDMETMGIDALCFTGHKSLYGPQGTGGLCLSSRFTPGPLLTGGSGSRSFSPVQPDFLPDHLEAGTLNGHGIAGLLAGLHYLREKGTAPFCQADALAREFYRLTQTIPGIQFYGDYDAPLRAPVVSLNLPGYGSAELAAELSDRYEIATRSGAHCAPLLHRRFGTEERGAVRFSFSHFNTPAEVRLAAEALAILAKEGQGF